MRWYYVVDGDVVGPVRTHYLSRIYSKNQITGETYVFNSKVVTDWTRLKYIVGLIDELVGKSSVGIFSDKSSSRASPHRKKRFAKKSSNNHSNVQTPSYHKSVNRKVQNSNVSDVFSEGSVANASQDQFGAPLTKDQRLLTIGDFVKFLDGRSGRVLYVGKVHTMRGEVLGVELNEEFRQIGNHDGALEDIRYFNCHPQRGVFVTRRQVSNIVVPPKEEKEVSSVRRVVSDLNLANDFDLISFQIACSTLKLNRTSSEMETAFNTYQASGKQNKTANDKLEELLRLLDLNVQKIAESSSSEGEPLKDVEKEKIVGRWRTFSTQQNKIEPVGFSNVTRSRGDTIGDTRGKLEKMKNQLESQMSVLDELKEADLKPITFYQKSQLKKKKTKYIEDVNETLNSLGKFNDKEKITNASLEMSNLLERISQLEEVNSQLRTQNSTLLSFVNTNTRG